MTTYIISYDLIKQPEEAYKELYEELDTMGAVKVLQSVRVVASNSSAKRIGARLLKHMHSKDRLLVVEFLNEDDDDDKSFGHNLLPND